jgi:hypothetical protein
MAKIIIWSKEEARKQLQQRLVEARDARRPLEKTWQASEKAVYSSDNSDGSLVGNSFDLDSALGIDDGPDQGAAGSIKINYTFKNLRYIHAQLAANPPSIIPRPTSSDANDRRTADAADRIVRFGMKQYDIGEVVDNTSLSTLLYGTGFSKSLWNDDAGEILDVNEETGELLMEGDYETSNCKIWDLYPDPEAKSWKDVRYMFERVFIPYEEALFKFGVEYKEILEQCRQKDARYSAESGYVDSAIRNKHYDVVELYEYWEKGLLSNGLLGRFCYCTRDGVPLGDVVANPERYCAPKKTAADQVKKKIEIAVLPYHCFTDIDVPNRLWGKSFVEYAAPVQDMRVRIDNVVLQSAQAHGIPRLVIYGNSEVAEDSITDSPMDIIKVSGNQKPDFIMPMPLSQVMPDLLARYKMGEDDMAGVNEAMFGQQSRETSGFSMQYSVNQGNMIRYRLLNKYRRFVEDLYKRYLLIIQNRWTTPRTICVLGQEKAFETVDLKGADIIGGYDILAEYGASLSLDPTTRREEMITLMPLFEKAGVESRQLLKMLKLNELAGAYDLLDLAADRQREIFEEMGATGKYIEPEQLQDHKNMLSYAYMYIMTSEFKYLPAETKVNIRKHILAREQVAASGPAGNGSTLEGTPGPAPAGGPGQLAAAAGAGAPPAGVAPLPT